MIGNLKPKLFILLLFLLPCGAIFAQPLLPDMVAATQNGVNILSWTCQYNGMKSIAVQRSADSLVNFATIGYVKDLKKGPQAFIDGHPQPGKNWYKLYIVFASDLTWYSNTIKLEVDSAQLLKQKVLPPNDSLQKFASKVKTTETDKAFVPANGTKGTAAVSATSGVDTTTKITTIKLVIDTVAKTTPKTAKELVAAAPEEDLSVYVKSQYIFTNPFTGHVNVEIPEAAKSFYSIRFYDRNDHPVLDIPRIREPSVIIDKHNFQHKGIYKFDLIKNKEKLESGFITIF